VYFRDTAHGFLAWATASLATAALLSSAIGSILGGGLQAGAAGAGATVGGVAASARPAPGSDAGPMGYFIDSLFRRETPTETTAAASSTPPATAGVSEQASGSDAAEVGRIFASAGRTQALPAEDLRYVGQIVARRTGLSQQDAQKRVTEIHAKAQAKARDAEVAARNAADKARKASAYGALWLFVSLLIGAFVASLSATFGGRRRDA